MSRVKIAELKDQLSRHLRAVEAGAVVTVTDRDRPIARIVPIPRSQPGVEVIPPQGDFREVRDLVHEPVHWPVSSTELLAEERDEDGRLRR